MLGLLIGDPRQLDRAVQAGVQYHFLTALAALCFATLVHAIVFTYFMGTGRWIEETSQAYRLPADFYRENQRVKYRLTPAIVGCFLMLLATGASAAADPGSPVQFAGWWGIPAATWHSSFAIATLGINLGVNYWEYIAVSFRNGEIVQAVLAEAAPDPQRTRPRGVKWDACVPRHATRWMPVCRLLRHLPLTASLMGSTNDIHRHNAR